MKIAIIYASRHHQNTEKVLDVIAGKYPVKLINADDKTEIDVSDFDCIGYASGIDFGKFYASVIAAAEKTMVSGKKVFFIYTCGKNSRDFSASLKALAQKKGCIVLGSFGCNAFDTYGPWKLVGGINKGHPDDTDIANAVTFFDDIRNK